MNLEHDATVSTSADVETPESGHSLRDAAQARHDLVQIAVGLGFAALYGLALGTESGGFALVRHAIGVPLGMCASTLVTAPALFVVLALLNTPITPSKLLTATARTVGVTGLLLAGLAPAAAMLIVTIGGEFAPVLVALGGFWLAGAIGLLGFVSILRSHIASASFERRTVTTFVFLGFSMIAVALAARAWVSLLPVLGGA